MRFFVNLFLVIMACVYVVTFLLLTDFCFLHGLIPVTCLDYRKVCYTLVQETSYETHPESLKAVSWLFYLKTQVIDLKVLGSNEGKVISSWDYDYIISYKCGICCLSLLT